MHGGEMGVLAVMNVTGRWSFQCVPGKILNKPLADVETEARKLTNLPQDNRNYIPGSMPTNWHRDPYNFMTDKNTGSIFSSTEVTLGELLKATRGGWSPERPSHDYKLGIFSPIPPSSREGRGG